MTKFILSKLLEDWKEGWRWFSVQAMILAAALQAVWCSLDATQKAALEPYQAKITLAILILGVCGRLVRQPTKRTRK